ncbi:hypothetical protein QUF95_00540 [Paenibacillus silvae]|nr:hypothetical protein [Paenibacillus silvae]
MMVRKAFFVGARVDASVAECPFDRHYPRIFLIHPLQGENSMINANASLLSAISASSAKPCTLDVALLEAAIHSCWITVIMNSSLIVHLWND